MRLHCIRAARVDQSALQSSSITILRRTDMKADSPMQQSRAAARASVYARTNNTKQKAHCHLLHISMMPFCTTPRLLALERRNQAPSLRYFGMFVPDIKPCA